MIRSSGYKTKAKIFHKGQGRNEKTLLLKSSHAKKDNSYEITPEKEDKQQWKENVTQVKDEGGHVQRSERKVSSVSN